MYKISKGKLQHVAGYLCTRPGLYMVIGTPWGLTRGTADSGATEVGVLPGKIPFSTNEVEVGGNECVIECSVMPVISCWMLQETVACHAASNTRFVLDGHANKTNVCPSFLVGCCSGAIPASRCNKVSQSPAHDVTEPSLNLTVFFTSVSTAPDPPSSHSFPPPHPSP